jgi:hypothetical protein
MTSRLPLALPVSVFRDYEPVIQSHPVLEGPVRRCSATPAAGT